MRVSLTIMALVAAALGEVPQQDQHDGEDLHAYAPPHQLVAAASALDAVAIAAAHGHQPGKQHAQRSEAGEDHQHEQDIDEGHDLAVVARPAPRRAPAHGRAASDGSLPVARRWIASATNSA